MDLDLISLDPDGIAADFESRVVGPGAVGKAKTPGVPGAGDDAVGDEAAAETGAHVRANLVDGDQTSAEDAFECDSGGTA